MQINNLNVKSAILNNFNLFYITIFIDCVKFKWCFGYWNEVWGSIL